MCGYVVVFYAIVCDCLNREDKEPIRFFFVWMRGSVSRKALKDKKRGDGREKPRRHCDYEIDGRKRTLVR